MRRVSITRSLYLAIWPLGMRHAADPGLMLCKQEAGKLGKLLPPTYSMRIAEHVVDR